MKFLFMLACRNVLRNKRRSVITFCAISFGLAALIAGKSLMDGIDIQSQRNIINSQTAHIKVFASGYFEERANLPLNLAIANPAQPLSAIKDTPHITGAVIRLNFGGLVISRGVDLGCVGIGIDPDTDPQVFNIKDSIKEGQFLESGEERALIGSDLARDLESRPGDWLTLQMLTVDSARNAVDLEVKGIFETGNPQVDNGTIFIPLDVAQQALDMDTSVTEIAIKLDNLSHLQQTSRHITDTLARIGWTYQAYRWDEIAGDFLKISQMKVKVTALISLVMIIVATLGITNTMLMAISERTKEIGMISALGMKMRSIMTLFILEGGILGFFGSLLGCLIGGGLSLYLEIYGWDISKIGEGISEFSASAYPIKNVYYADLRWDIIIQILVLGIVVSIIASIYAAWRAARLNPTEALRYV